MALTIIMNLFHFIYFRFKDSMSSKLLITERQHIFFNISSIMIPYGKIKGKYSGRFPSNIQHTPIGLTTNILRYMIVSMNSQTETTVAWRIGKISRTKSCGDRMSYSLIQKRYIKGKYICIITYIERAKECFP